MAIEEALSLIINKSKASKINDKIENSPTAAGLKYLFDVYSRVEEEKRQYPKVNNNLSNTLFLLICLLVTFIIFRKVVLKKFQMC